MRTEWPVSPLEGVCSGIYDCPHSTPKLSDSGPYMARTQDIRQGFFNVDAAVHVSEDIFEQRTKRVEPTSGDLLFSREGTYFGDAAEVPPDTRVCLGQRMVLIRPNPNIIQASYLRMQINSPAIQSLIRQFRDGTVAERLNLPVIRSLSIVVPPSEDQKYIVDKILPLEKKIQLNRRMNTTLEAMAQALFKSWFVDFDPVVDNALAAGNPIPEPFHKRAEARRALGDKRKPLPADIAQHFPDRFVFNEEMGWVPDGWEVETIGKVLELAYGKSLPAKKRIDGDIPVYGSGGISGSHNEKLVEGPGIIVGRKGTVGSLYWVEHAYFPIDTVFYVIRKLDLPLYWIYQSLQLIDIKSLGADSAVPGVNRNAIYAKFFTIPKDDIFKGYLNIIEKNIAKQKNIDLENGILIQLRDTLLPKLLSGQLRIPNAENFFKDADKALQFEEAAQVDEEWLDAPLSDDEVCNS